jgi:maleylacetate reductase
MTHEFSYTAYAQQIVFGAGALIKLPEAIDRFGWRRLVLCTSGSAQRMGHVAALAAALGDRLVAAYDRTAPHVPEDQVFEALTLAEEHAAEAIVGLGGGSPIGLAKATAQALEERRSGAPARAAYPTDQPHVPVVAIPTTYAGSEMTAIYGVTRVVDGVARKTTVTDPKVAAKLVIYDPLLTLDLPAELTASTGINALAHCVEALYSVTRHPLSTAAALGGARAIARALPRCYVDGRDIEARSEMLVGAHQAGASLANVAMALHHGICHVLGGTAGVPHGVANSIILPHAMRFNLDATTAELARFAETIGIAREGRGDAALAEASIEHVAALIAQLGLPQRLRDAGVPEAALPQLAELAFQSQTVRNNPKPIGAAAELEALLRAAW